MLARGTLLLLLALASTFVPAPPGANASQGDISVMQAASVRLGHQQAAVVVSWLRKQRAVRSAALGRDGRTVEIVFRDGLERAILPPLSRVQRLPVLRDSLRPLARTAANPGARAVVLEPFATELLLGPTAGDPEVNALRSAGFQVDQAYDTNVTVNSMATLPDYDVVYMHTHTGVSNSGGGLLATGQPTTCGAYANADGSVVAVGVAGTTQCYLAITAAYVANHMAQFPSNSIVFVNGCDLLATSDFVGALSARGVGVTISWDNLSQTFDDYLSGAAFFNQMKAGATVSSALATLYQNGYGKSNYNGKTATLTYRGNGSLTLQAAASGTTTPPAATSVPTATRVVPASTPVPTNTSQPTSTPRPTGTALATATHTPVPTATATRVPPAASLSAVVKPGADQVVTVQHLEAGTTVHVAVSFPNGDKAEGTTTADGSGLARYSFNQRASEITRHVTTATVTITGTTAGAPFTLTEHYQIGFGPVDVSVQPREQHAGGTVTIYVHAAGHTKVMAGIRHLGRRIAVRHGRTGAGGWTSMTYKIPGSLKAGARFTVRVTATEGKKTLHTLTTVKVV